MAVIVDKGWSSEERYENAQIVAVDAGHLLVRKHAGTGGAKTVAIHAPGDWHEAVVVED